MAASGGYGITHVARLERTDGSEFGSVEAKAALDALSFFFSFTRGAWSSCILPVGFGADGSARWAEWSRPRVAPGSVTSWFNSDEPGAFAELLRGVLLRSQQPTWWEAITLALNWYYECNDPQGMIFTALVLQQNALELLSWATFVDNGPLSEDGFDKMPASDRIRLMLHRANIPVAIPRNLADLTKLAGKKGWDDGPHAITEIRNAFVHPKKRKRVGELPGRAYAEAWRLGVWYLELCLLRVFEFSGSYCSRVSGAHLVGPPERVPWAPPRAGQASS